MTNTPPIANTKRRMQGSDSLIVEIQANDNVAEARQGQEIKRHIYGGDTAENAIATKCCAASETTPSW